MLLDKAQSNLAWPSRQEVLEPNGAGARIVVDWAREKIGHILREIPEARDAEIGILTGNPASHAVEAPIAVVCEFKRAVSRDTLFLAHKLAWNFCRTPLLLTVEPTLVRAWTCCEPPGNLSDTDAPGAEVDVAKLDGDVRVGDQISQSLHWVHLVSGDFFRKHADRFKRNRCADEVLLANLKFVRDALHEEGDLDFDTIHDLLARIIFAQFLFQRKDSAGKAALNPAFFEKLFRAGQLTRPHLDLPSILASHQDTYALFRLLNERFNGDLFPGRGATPEEQEAEWRDEMDRVTQSHLNLLSDFVSGEMVMRKGERSLWPFYSFDVIPLEFISSVYEAFLGEESQRSGAHYTPAHLVDFMLDSVLPWESNEWDISVLDPACGSGIFLVKAYQRLIHRWKRANGRQPDAAILRQILEKNLFGVDINPHAARVASFSLYLAMCDEIDPRHYWSRVRFPRLRGTRLIAADFFDDSIAGFRTYPDGRKFDLIVGNAPWGRNTTSAQSTKWSKRHQEWVTTYNSVGPLFLAKCSLLAKPTGRVTMLQAGGLLFNTIDSAQKFRQKLFSTVAAEEVVNLSALRFGLFQKAIAPACIVTFRAEEPDGKAIQYKCPKPVQSTEDEFRIVIEPHDVQEVQIFEAVADARIWTTLMWGGRRDLALVRKLSHLPTLRKYSIDGVATSRQGVIRGDRRKLQCQIEGRRILNTDQFPEETFLKLDPKRLPRNKDPFTHSRDSTDYSAFDAPQLVLKQGWQQQAARFHAALIDTDKPGDGILCSKSYVSVHVSPEHRDILSAACLAYNSKFAVYYLLLTSGRFATYRPEVNVDDLLNVPIPDPSPGLIDGLASYSDVDDRAREAFQLKPIERVLVEDLFSFTLPDFKGDSNAPSRLSTRDEKGEDSFLIDYCTYFMRVLKAAFGKEKSITATIFAEADGARLPVRLVAFHLNWPSRRDIVRESFSAGKLFHRLEELNQAFISNPSGGDGGIFHQRVARIYDSIKDRKQSIPSVFLVKPDRRRYWTRSIAIRDADAVAADIMLFQEPPQQATARREIIGG